MQKQQAKKEKSKKQKVKTKYNNTSSVRDWFQFGVLVYVVLYQTEK